MQADWRTRVAEGDLHHPLDIETDDWHLICIGRLTARAGWDIQINATSARPNDFSEMEQQMVETYLLRPEIEWALDNSFDGLYVKRVHDKHSMDGMVYYVSAYLHAKHATYWKLKYGNRT